VWSSNKHYRTKRRAIASIPITVFIEHYILLHHEAARWPIIKLHKSALPSAAAVVITDAATRRHVRITLLADDSRRVITTAMLLCSDDPYGCVHLQALVFHGQLPNCSRQFASINRTLYVRLCTRVKPECHVATERIFH